MASSAHMYTYYNDLKKIFLRQLRLKGIRNKIAKIRLVNSNYKNKDNSITFLIADPFTVG